MKAKITVQRCIVGRGKTPVPGYHVWRSYTSATSCGTLRSYWRYGGCGYHKGSYTCSEPDHIDTCSVPRPRLRNGRLSQTAFSLFLFVRDIMGGDLIGWSRRSNGYARGKFEPAPSDRKDWYD